MLLVLSALKPVESVASQPPAFADPAPSVTLWPEIAVLFSVIYKKKPSSLTIQSSNSALFTSESFTFYHLLLRLKITTANGYAAQCNTAGRLLNYPVLHDTVHHADVFEVVKESSFDRSAWL